MAPQSTTSSSMSGMNMSSMNMPNMSMSSMSGSSSSMMTMMTVFQTSMNTPLYSMAWMPTTKRAYALTCVFLIILGVIFRALLAARSIQEARWLDKELKRRYLASQGEPAMGERMSSDGIPKKMVWTENGVEESVMVVQRHQDTRRPWRLSVDPLRAVVDTIVAGVGYLLMLAVMTMNVGYFASVLGGLFLGSLLVGRFIMSGDH